MTTQNDINLKAEVAYRVNYLGDSEYALALVRAQAKDIASIEAVVNEHRKTFYNGRIIGGSTGEFATTDTWKAIAADSEKAARAELTKDSDLTSELNRLEVAAAEAKRIADAKAAELTALWTEYQNIPARIEAITDRLDAIPAQLDALDEAKIEASIKKAAREVLDGGRRDLFADLERLELLLTTPLRREVLETLSSELQDELATLKARQKTLAKRLGQKA